jgi:hypothetical protein
MSADDLRRRLTQACEDQALEAGDDRYVDCTEARGAGDLVGEMETVIRDARDRSCQLFTGHRGCGKTSELYRLEARLEDHSSGPRFCVGHCVANEWMDPALTDVD